jgi:hypothetical protein
MSVLLTDEAVRKAAGDGVATSPHKAIHEDADRIANVALEWARRYLATEGREALVEAVARVVFSEHITADQIPEAVVAALVGEKS